MNEIHSYPSLVRHVSKLNLYHRSNDDGGRLLTELLPLFQRLRRIDQLEIIIHGRNDVEFEFYTKQRSSSASNNTSNDTDPVDVVSVMSVCLGCRRPHHLEAVLKMCSSYMPCASVILDRRESFLLRDDGEELMKILSTLSSFGSAMLSVQRVHIRGCFSHQLTEVSGIVDFLTTRTCNLQVLRWTYPRGAGFMGRINPLFARGGMGTSRQHAFSPATNMITLEQHLACIPQLVHLQEVTFFGCWFGDALVGPLRDLLQRDSSQIVKLDIQFNNLSQSGQESLQGAVGRSKSLRIFRCDGVEERACRMLLHHLQYHNCTLQEFSCVGDEGGEEYDDGNTTMGPSPFQSVQFLCGLNTVGRGRLRRQDITVHEYIDVLGDIMKDEDVGKFRCSGCRGNSKDANTQSLVYGLLRDDPAKWLPHAMSL